MTKAMALVLSCTDAYALSIHFFCCVLLDVVRVRDVDHSLRVDNLHLHTCARLRLRGASPPIGPRMMPVKVGYFLMQSACVEYINP